MGATAMIELLFVACLGTRCVLEPVPITYPSRERCAMAAAVTAGRIRGRLHLRDPLFYRFKCHAGDPCDPWYAMIDGRPAAVDLEVTVRGGS
jgi:hypothetical protein